MGHSNIRSVPASRNLKTFHWLALLLAGVLYTGVQPRVHASTEDTEQLILNTLALDANRQRGERLFRSQCAACHGKQALGDAERLVPALAAQRRAYVIKQLADFAQDERDATQMHAVLRKSKVANPQAWADLALYLNKLPTPSAPQTGDGTFLDLGERSYTQRCAGCHGDDGRGDDDGFVPSLRNQHYAYLLRETQMMAIGHRAVEPDLVRFIGSLSNNELIGIADYVSRLAGPVEDRARLRDDGTLTD